MHLRHRPLALAAGLALLVTAWLSHAQAPAPTSATTLRVIVFDGGWNLPLWIAQRNGLFEAQGLTVQLAYTPTSAFLVNSMLENASDIGFAAIDNVVAYQEGQGEAKIPDNPDLFAFMGGDGGFISIIAAPNVGNVAVYPPTPTLNWRIPSASFRTALPSCGAIRS